MANEILQKSRATITAQAAGLLTADEDPNSNAYTGGATTVLNNTYVGNCKGADNVRLELDVTIAPTVSTPVRIWWRGSENNSDWTKWKYSHTITEAVVNEVDRYDGGLFALSYQYNELKIVALDYGFTAALYATPKVREVQ